MLNISIMKNKKHDHLNEQGIVSIVVTMIIMIVLSLIVTGFAQLARREQREALDRQLSTQANYAAESGINALKAALPFISTDSRTDCSNPDNVSVGAGAPSNPFKDSDLGNNASYTCVLFNKKPKSLIYQDVNSDDAIVAPLSLKSSAGVPIALNNLTISWKAKNGSTTIKESNLGVFPVATSWNNSIGILRLDLIPIPDSGVITTQDLDNNQKTKSFLLQPQKINGETTKSYSAITSGGVIGVKCNETANSGCVLTITDLTLNNYYLRMRSIYNTSSVTLNGNTVAGGGETTSGFSGAQIEIDSTGKATDVLRRIKVRIEDPSSSLGSISSLTFPEYVFSSSESLCKQLSLAPGSSTNACN